MGDIADMMMYDDFQGALDGDDGFYERNIDF
jgi:hypothetical protein